MLNIRRVLGACLLLLSVAFVSVAQTDFGNINRGTVAVKDGNQVFVSWRYMDGDAEGQGFNLYRITGGGSAEKLNDAPITGATNFVDSIANTAASLQYYVKPVNNGVEAAEEFVSEAWLQNYLSIPLQVPAGGSVPDGTYTYNANDASVADLDGDGDLEVLLKWDPSNAKDNSQSGYTGNVLLDAYELDGTFLWRIDFGINVRAGAHYVQFMAYDFDGDGKAEIAARTASGSKDGQGNLISKGPAASVDHGADYRNSGGYILSGPEFLTMFRGTDGAELGTTALEPNRGSVSDWGDSYGNRVDRFLGAVAYLDGQKPSLVWCRGIYEKSELAAFDWDGTDFTLKWIFTADNSQNQAYIGVGSHNLTVGDVDADGNDEIIYGGCAIDDDGTGMWTNGNTLGKGSADAGHLSDIMPDREGLEKFGIIEGTNNPGSYLVDAKTGEVLWSTGPADVGRGVAGDLVPEYYGMECWGGTDGLRSAHDARVGNAPSSYNFVIWWDGDLSRELFDNISVRKYQLSTQSEKTIFVANGCSSNNGSKATPALQADIFGDWREEVMLRTSDNKELRIFTTTIPTEYRLKTLLHDRQYRLAVAWQNNSYNQPPHPGFYLGNDMFTDQSEIPPSKPSGFNLTLDTAYIMLAWNANLESDVSGYELYRAVDEPANFELITGGITDLEYKDVDFEFDHIYYYYLLAKDNDGNYSISSDTLSGLPTLRPDFPANVYASQGITEVMVFWDSAQYDQLAGYNVYVSDAMDGNFTKVNSQPIQTTNFKHEGLTSGQTYYYLVRSVGPQNTESYDSPVAMVTAGSDLVFQAENGVYDGVFIDSDHTGFNGDAFVNFDVTGYVAFKYVFSEKGGWYDLVVRYAFGGSGDRTGTITVNDSIFAYTMKVTAGWTTYIYDTVKIVTKAGFENEIRFDATGGDFGNLDEIQLAGKTASPNFDCSGLINGTAYLDDCGVCVGGATGLTECATDLTVNENLSVKPSHADLCLTIDSEALVQDECASSEDFAWILEKTSSNYYKIKNLGSGNYLAVDGSYVSESATGDEWRFEQKGDNYLIIPSADLTKDLAVLRASTEAGEKLVLISRSTASASHGFSVEAFGDILSTLNAAGFVIFPNPTTSEALISYAYSGADAPRIKITNLSGQLLKSELMTQGGNGVFEYTLRRNSGNIELMSGLYLVSIMVQGETVASSRIMFE